MNVTGLEAACGRFAKFEHEGLTTFGELDSEVVELVNRYIVRQLSHQPGTYVNFKSRLR